MALQDCLDHGRRAEDGGPGYLGEGRPCRWPGVTVRADLARGPPVLVVIPAGCPSSNLQSVVRAEDLHEVRGPPPSGPRACGGQPLRQKGRPPRRPGPKDLSEPFWP
eukprot:13950527-Alexandrium_andersonii.AAC.1